MFRSNSVTRVVLVIAGLATAAALTACGGGTTTPQAAGSSAESSSATKAATSAEKTSSGKATADKPAAPCPTTPAALLKAFKANKELASNIGPTKGFTNVTCSNKYAMAMSVPEDAEADAVQALFVHDGSGWKAVTAGTHPSCKDHFPASEAANFPNCDFS